MEPAEPTDVWFALAHRAEGRASRERRWPWWEQGLSAVVTSRLHGPRLVISIEPDENRLDTARQLGADHTINPSRQDPREEFSV